VSDQGSIVADLERLASQVSPEKVPALLSELERIKAILWIRLHNGDAESGDQSAGEEDRLLTAEQAAEYLQVPKAYVYELARRRELPSVRLGERYVRFRARALAELMSDPPKRPRG
jgi:excisionase family DNA binding protein